MRSRLLVVARVARDELVERRLRVEHQRGQSAARDRGRRRDPTRSRSISLRRVRQLLEPERVGEALGRVDRDDAPRCDRGARPRARAPRRSSSCRRRRCRSTRRRGASSTSSASVASSSRSHRLDAERRARRRAASTSAGPMSAVKRNGSRICGSGSRSREPRDLLVLDGVALGAEARPRARGRRPRVRTRSGRAAPRRRAASARSTSPASRAAAKHPFTTIGPERDAGAVLDRERGVDQLVDRRLLGQRHEHHLAARRVGEQLDDVGGLLADGPDPHRVEQAAGREQEGDRVPGRGRVDMIRSAAPACSSDFTLPSTRMSFMPGTAVATTSSAPDCSEALRDPPHPVVLEVLEQGVVGGEGPGPEPAVAARLPRRSSGGAPKHAASPDLPSTSTISTLMPVRAAAVASAAVTVVFPTPPLPATITTREAEQKRSSSMATDATGAPIARRCRTERGTSHASRGRVLAIVVAVSVLALDALAGAATRSGRQARHRRRAGRGLPRPAERVAHPRRDRRGQRRSDRRCSSSSSKSSGAIDVDVDERRARDPDSRSVPVAVWVGPSGADAKGAATLLLQAAHLAYIAPGSGAGPGQPVRLDDPDASSRAGVADRARPRSPRRNGRDPDGARRARDACGSARRRPRAVGATNGVRPTIGELIVRLDGKTVTTAAGERRRSRPPR